MENNLKEIIKPVKIINILENEKDINIIESKKYNLLLLNEEYELIMNLYNIYIEFKLIKKNIIYPYYYKQKYDLENINKLLYTFFKEIKEVYNFYDKILNKNRVKLIIKEDKININFKNIINLDNEIETNLELKKIKINKDDILYILINEINILKNKLNNENEMKEYINNKNNEIKNEIKEKENKMKEYINNKNNEIKNEIKEKENKMKEYIDNKINEIKNEIIKENKKIIEEKINIIDNINEIKKEYEDKIKEFKNKQNEIISEINKNLNLLLNEYNIKKEKVKEKEIERKNNDNVNLINDFKCYNINKLNNNIISNNLNITWWKSVAVYNIIRNNEILYEIAYPDNKNGYNIIIYNILLNNITNKINNAHSNNIHKIKHYYHSKNHLLLTSSEDKSIKIWNISLYPISNILKINNCFDGDKKSPFCMLFNKEDYFILGGSRNKKKEIWNKNGNLIGPIEKSNLNYGRFIETTYIDNKPYILLSGEYHSECYDYNNNTIKTYKSNKYKYNNEHMIINLFKKNEIIYLISGDFGGNVIIFDFRSTNEISSISFGYYIYSLCSLNEKYILVGGYYSGELKIIDFDNKSIVKNYSAHNNYI